MRKKGRFIVIDGTDGSGKKTQTNLLIKKLRKAGYKARTIDFPQYENTFFGKTVGKYLRGEFGSASHVSPYLASILYAGDRFEMKKKIENWLKGGFIVIADRYASSNQIHQGGKIKNYHKRKEFLSWLEELEFKVFKIPRPDMIVYLDVPVQLSSRLLKNKSAQGRKKYLDGKKDIHESDLQHLKAARASAMKIIEKNNSWIKINCVLSGKILSVEKINDIIWKKLGF